MRRSAPGRAILRDGLGQGHAIIAAAEVAADATRILLFPMGRHVTRDGRGPFILKGTAHADRVIAATKSRLGSCASFFDYDHQVVADVAKSGTQAKAAGWIKSSALSADDQGIWGEVEWTPAARAALADRGYRSVRPF